MPYLKQLWARLRRGKDLDAYTTIIAAISASVFSFFDVLPENQAAGLLLAIVAILALNSLTTRISISEMLDSKSAKDLRFLSDFPEELRSRRESSENIYLIGVDLGRTIETSYGAFERSLRRGGAIRILLTDPEADGSAIDARCQLSRPEIAEMRDGIRSSLRKLAKLNDLHMGSLEVRVTMSALKFGLNYVDVARPVATLYVQLYGMRLAGESRPIFKVTTADGEWFDCYQGQAETLWEEARPVDLEGPI